VIIAWDLAFTALSRAILRWRVVPRRVVSEAARGALGVAQRAAGLAATVLRHALRVFKPTTPTESTMTERMIDLPGVIARSDDADVLRELIRDAAQRLMDVEVAAVCGAGHGERKPGPGEPAQRLSAKAVGYPCRHQRTDRSEAAQGHLEAVRPIRAKDEDGATRHGSSPSRSCTKAARPSWPFRTSTGRDGTGIGRSP